MESDVPTVVQHSNPHEPHARAIVLKTQNKTG